MRRGLKRGTAGSFPRMGPLDLGIGCWQEGLAPQYRLFDSHRATAYAGTHVHTRSDTPNAYRRTPYRIVTRSCWDNPAFQRNPFTPRGKQVPNRAEVSENSPVIARVERPP
jgi:hypothetical protein